MKRFVAHLLAVSMLLSILPMAVNAQGEDDFTVAKHNWIVGTQGMINAPDSAVDVTYISNDEAVATVDDDGVFTAVGAGSTSIIPLVEGVRQTPVNITVLGKSEGSVTSYIKDDVAAEKLVLNDSYWNPITMKDKRKGTKLYQYIHPGYGLSLDEASGNVCIIGSNNNSLMGYAYKLDGELNNALVDLYAYDDLLSGEYEDITKRTTIGYLTDDSITVYDKSLVKETTWNDENMTQYGAEEGMLDTAENGAYILDGRWTKVDAEWSEGVDDRNNFAVVKNIPANAKYLAVIVNCGLLENGAPASAAAGYYAYRGIMLNYKVNAAAEALSDNRVAVTFGKSVPDIELNVKKNGNAAAPQVDYDSDTYTYYIDGGFTGGDIITIDTEYGIFSAAIPNIGGDIDYDSASFTVDKVNYIAGTKGLIHASVLKDGLDITASAPITYTSTNENMTVNTLGEFTANGEGAITITPYIGKIAQEPITITVYPKGESSVRSHIKDDVAAEKLVLNDSYWNPITMKDKRKGTKLYQYIHPGYGLSLDEASGNVCIGGNSADNYLMGYAYKLDGELNNALVDLYAYDDLLSGEYEDITKRTTIGYLTDDSITVYDRSLERETTWNDENMTQYGAEEGMLDTAENGAYILDGRWTKVDAEWSEGVDDRNNFAVVKNIPANAKYLAVIVNCGLLENGAPASAAAGYYAYRGITLNYKIKQIAGEITADNKIALTFNDNIGAAPNLTVKVNGEEKSVTTEYDPDTYTLYVSGFEQGDKIEIVSAYGEYSCVLDSREQIKGITFTDGVIDGVLNIDSDTVAATVSFANLEKTDVKVYAALYDSIGELKKVAVKNAADDDVSITLEGISIEPGDTLKVFCWDGLNVPIKNYSNVQTVYETDDF